MRRFQDIDYRDPIVRKLDSSQDQKATIEIKWCF